MKPMKSSRKPAAVEKWVVNASPVIALARVGQVELLMRLPERVVIPQAVAQELRNAPEENPLAWSAIKAQYGEPAKTTYSNYLQWSMTYIYPDRGLAFVAAEGPDVVFIQECFIPMTLDEYMNTWGKLLPAENPFTE